MSQRAAELIADLGLEPHPEGGHYREVFRSARRVRSGDAERAALTTIYYLLRRGEVGRWHVVDADEVWHFLDGDPLELVTYDPASGEKTVRRLGPAAPASGPAEVVPAGLWQAARPLGEYALAGCTVAPGFEFAGFRLVRDLADHEAAFAGALGGTESLL